MTAFFYKGVTKINPGSIQDLARIEPGSILSTPGTNPGSIPD